MIGIFTGKAHLDSHFINKPPDQRGGTCPPTPLSASAPCISSSQARPGVDCHRHLLCLPRCSRGDGMVLWIPWSSYTAGVGSQESEFWRGMRICMSLLSRVGFSVGSWESEGPFPGILTSQLGSEDFSISASPSPPLGTQELWVELENFRQPHLCSL